MYSGAPAIGALLLAFVAALVLAPSMPPAMAQSANLVRATYVDYDAPSENRDLAKAGAKLRQMGFEAVSCTLLESMLPEWLARYWWVSFCGPEGPRGDEACGRCLQLTDADTGASTTGRIVDDCSKSFATVGLALAMDKPLFKLYDTDSLGMYNSQLKMNYQFVDCQD